MCLIVRSLCAHYCTVVRGENIVRKVCTSYRQTHCKSYSVDAVFDNETRVEN